MTRRNEMSRRKALTVGARGLGASTVLAAGFPAIVPASVLGATAPSNRINVGAIGTGRISRTHDMPGVWKHDHARIVAVCDLDRRRMEDAKGLVNGHYGGQAGRPYDGVTGYLDYRELLASRDVDAVLVSTPDHWHALVAIAAVEAGKDVYLQKPASLTIAEGRALSNAVHRTGRIFQIGSQQRSAAQFRYAAELVRNGRIGQLRTVQVGLPGDPSGDEEAGDAGPEGPQLRDVAGLDASRLLHREARPPAGGLRPPGLAAVRAVRGRDDHRLGRPPHRQRPLGDGHGAHRAGRDLRLGGVPEEGPLGRARAVPDRGGLRGRRADDRERRVSERHQVRGDGGVGLRLPRQRDGDRERSGGEAEGRPGALRQRSEDPHVGHRPLRGPPLREPGPPRQLARLHPLEAGAHRPGGGGPPVLLRLPPPPHRDEDEAHAPLGPAQGALPERRRGERHAVAAPALAVRHRRLGR